MKSQTAKVYPVHLYLQDKRYELLRRRALHEGHNSLQQVANTRLFKSNWLQELEKLRVEQRKLGYKDETFFHPKVLRSMGIKVKRGRRRLWATLPKT